MRYTPLHFSGNPITISVEAVSEATTERNELLYYCEVQIPKAYRAAQFAVLVTLSGAEKPPRQEGDVWIFDGWSCNIAPYLDAVLQTELPEQTATGWQLHPMATMPFRVRTWVENGGVVVAGSEEITDGVVLKGALNERQFPMWKQRFFTDYLAEKRWLTWRPAEVEQLVELDSPAFLSFLTNLDPCPAELRLRVARTNEGNPLVVDEEVVRVLDVQPNAVYTFAVGVEAVRGNEALGYYDVWLEDEAGNMLTGLKRFVLNAYQTINPVRHLCFVNSVGGIDVLWCEGELRQELNTTRQEAERALEAHYGVSSKELFVSHVRGQRAMVVHTGYIEERAVADWLEEILWAKEIAVATAEGFVPIVLADTDYKPRGEHDLMDGWTFKFKQSQRAVGYSALPAEAIGEERPTKWVPTKPYYVQNIMGFRVAMASQLLELHYADGPMERVKGVLQKANLPGTVGYVPPIPITATAPFVNVAISRQGTYEKKTCTSGFGTTALVEIAAGLYGGETQADANRLAEAAWSAKNTQAYADANGSCNTSPQAYTQVVPDGYTWWRINAVRTGYADNYVLIYDSAVDKNVAGNGWPLTLDQPLNDATCCYASGRWDVKFPSLTSTQQLYLGVYGKNVKTEVFANGALIQTFLNNATTDTDGDDFVKHLVNKTYLGNMAKVYVKITAI